MEINGYRLTDHITRDRIDRIADILVDGGFGTEIKRIPSSHNKHGVFEVLTTTGVLMVVDEVTKECITAYKISKQKLHYFLTHA